MLLTLTHGLPLAKCRQEGGRSEFTL